MHMVLYPPNLFKFLLVDEMLLVAGSRKCGHAALPSSAGLWPAAGVQQSPRVRAAAGLWAAGSWAAGIWRAASGLWRAASQWPIRRRQQPACWLPFTR